MSRWFFRAVWNYTRWTTNSCCAVRELLDNIMASALLSVHYYHASVHYKRTVNGIFVTVVHSNWQWLVAIETLDTDAGNVVLVTESLGEKTITYLPGEYRRTLSLVLSDACHDLRRRYTRFTAANRSWTNRASLVIAAKYLTHTAVWYLSVTRV